MNFSVIDLHCDLLSYLELSPTRTPYDQVVHCAIPQLKSGHVKLQVLAVFTRTEPHSVLSGRRQLEIYEKLCHLYPTEFCFYIPSKKLLEFQGINLLCAIENASGLWEEQESFTIGLKRLKTLILSPAKPLYIGLTWHSENRFGGGNASQVGLKAEGKLLLEELDHQNIAIDLSHTSDALADGILDYIEYKNLNIPVLASHSNARAILNHPRNLPDVIIKEIFRRGGVIGLNFYKGFLGSQNEDFLRHLLHFLELGGEKQICFGADFFYELDLALATNRQPELPYFLPFQDASCYPKLLKFFKRELGLTDDQLEALARKNAECYIQKLLN